MKHVELSSNCTASVLRALFICSTAGFFVETVYCNFRSHQLLVFHIVPDHLNICCWLCLLALCFCEAAPAKLLLYETLQNLKQVKKMWWIWPNLSVCFFAASSLKNKTKKQNCSICPMYSSSLVRKLVFGTWVEKLNSGLLLVQSTNLLYITVHVKSNWSMNWEKRMTKRQKERQKTKRKDHRTIGSCPDF